MKFDQTSLANSNSGGRNSLLTVTYTNALCLVRRVDIQRHATTFVGVIPAPGNEQGGMDGPQCVKF